MRVIIAENPMMAKKIAPFTAERWPGEEIMILASMPYDLNKYVYPRGLAYSDYPFLGSPDYKKTDARFEDGTFGRGVRVTNGKFISNFSIAFKSACNLMQTAKHLVFAGDWDHAGVWGMERMLELLAPERDKTDYDVAVFNGGLDEASIRRVLSNLRRPDDEQFLALSNAAKVKRYFDYNFNVNSLAILGNLYRDVAGTNTPVLITKNMVQILIHAVSNGEVAEAGSKNRLHLSRWRGTGKYDPDAFEKYDWWLEGLGSAASRPALLKQMTELGLLEPVGDSERPFLFVSTELGRTFEGRLHKDCTDQDLPFRLNLWMAKPFEEAKLSIDQYLLTFFRKQKRHQAV
jgi:hypothetical protein